MKGKYNFSWKHWATIFICFLLFFLTNVVTSDSENVILPLLAEENNWDYFGKVLTIATVAGCLSVVGNLFLGKLCEKTGARFIIVFGLLTTAGFTYLYGTASNYIALCIGLIGTICCGQCIGFFGGNTIIANWFPKKKGLAMGFVSVGPPFATIVMVSALTFLIRRTGVRGGIYVICGVLIAMAIICAIVIRDYPEQVGTTPDNLPKEEGLSVEEAMTAKGRSTREIIKDKNLWLITAIIGIGSISQTALMAQWIVRYKGTDFESIAGLLMSIAAVIGIFASMVIGFLENKLGTKKAYFVVALWFAAAFVLNFTNVKPLVYISVVMFGFAITLIQIFMPAYEVSAFGREDFKQANAIIFPVISLCGQLSFLVISACKKAFGEVRYVYLVCAILLIVSLILNAMLRLERKHS